MKAHQNRRLKGSSTPKPNYDNAAIGIELSAYFRLVGGDLPSSPSAASDDDVDEDGGRRLLFGLFSASADAYQKARLILAVERHSGMVREGGTWPTT